MIKKLTPQYCFEEHKKAFTNWSEGAILKHWHDENNNLCVKYESGNWWHYRINKHVLEWW